MPKALGIKSQSIPDFPASTRRRGEAGDPGSYQSKIPAFETSDVSFAGMVRGQVQEAILAPLVFFSLYGLPLNKARIWELLYKVELNKEEFESALEELVRTGKVLANEEMYSLKPLDEGRLLVNRSEIEKRWKKVERYYKLLACIPFIEHLSIIHSLAIGNVDQESDIDLLVITKPNRLYLVRSIIIVLFRMLGIYKTRTKISEQFCFGYYLTTESWDISQLEGQDDFLAFWFASHIPVLNDKAHQQFLKANQWIYNYFPNYESAPNPPQLKISRSTQGLKTWLEVLFWLPSLLLEPTLRWIHVRHTFKLPENSWSTSTTIAKKDALKLHAVSQRRQINEAFERALLKIDIKKESGMNND